MASDVELGRLLNRKGFFHMRGHFLGERSEGPSVLVSLDRLDPVEVDLLGAAGFKPHQQGAETVKLIYSYNTKDENSLDAVVDLFKRVRPHLTGFRASAVDSWKGWTPDGPHAVT